MQAENSTKKLSLFVGSGTLDKAYAPFMIAASAVAMEMEIQMFFYFYGLELVKKKLNLKVSPAGNPAMPFQLPFGPEWLQKKDWPLPNFITNNMPFFDTMATSLMKKKIKNKNIPSLEELRQVLIEGNVKLCVCQTSAELFGYTSKDFINSVEFCGAVSALEFSSRADMMLNF